MKRQSIRTTAYRMKAPVSARLAVLADFHNDDPAAALRMLAEDSPDLITVPGDVISGHTPDEAHPAVDDCVSALELLRGCAALAPTYLSLGNHEWAVDEADLQLLRDTGAIVLDNAWVRDDTTGFVIGGLSSGRVVRYRSYRDRSNAGRQEPERYPFSKKEIYARDPWTDHDWLESFEAQDGYHILLSHHPEYWSLHEPHLIDRDIELVLSGHAHGGQICIGGRGLVAPGQGFLPRFTSGVHEGPHGRMIISRGMSNPQHPIPRWGNPREILYVALGDR